MNNNFSQRAEMFYHLKGKFLMVDKDGRLASKQNYDKNQVSAILRYLHNGNFKGMFNILKPSDYELALEMNYDKIIANTINKEEKNVLQDERKRRLQELESFYEQSVQVQPEM